jgi:hypothetical protein
VDLLEDDDLVITVERKVQGEPLRSSETTPAAAPSAGSVAQGRREEGDAAAV